MINPIITPTNTTAKKLLINTATPTANTQEQAIKNNIIVAFFQSSMKASNKGSKRIKLTKTINVKPIMFDNVNIVTPFYI